MTLKSQVFAARHFRPRLLYVLGFALLVLAGLTTLGWWALKPPPKGETPQDALPQDELVAKWIEKQGGYFARDEKLPGHPIVLVNLIGTPVTDAELKELASLTRQNLSLSLKADRRSPMKLQLVSIISTNPLPEALTRAP